MPVVYRGVELDPAYRIDILVEKKVVIEVKAVDGLHPIHSAQLLTYMRFGRYQAGLLFNFNSVLLKDGMKRLVLNYHGPKPSG